jgi:hypothetical protein
LLKNFKILFIYALVFVALSSNMLCAAAPAGDGASGGGKSGRVDMTGLFVKGTLGCLYGMATIGGINAVIVLMGENTKGNLYRAKYGFAVGALLGLAYGTIMGVTGNDLLPKGDAGGGADAAAPAPEASNIHKNIYYALSNLMLEKDKDGVKISTKLINLRF